MATGPRVQLLPATFDVGPAGGVFPTFSAAGIDAAGTGGTAFATAWSTNLGVYYANPNGAVWLYYLCGTTAAGVTQILVGDLVGGTGQVLPATTYQITIAANSSGWIPPLSPGTFNQQAPTLVTYSGAINTTALTAGMQGCVVVDFTTTTTLCVRAYTAPPVFP